MFKVAVENSFDFQSEDYAELFGRSCATAFQHPIWLAHLYGSLLKNGAAERLIIVVRREVDGRLALVLPLIRRRYAVLKTVEFADLGVSDYVSPIADVDTFDRITADPDLVSEICRHLLPYDLLRIRKLPAHSLKLERLLGIELRESMAMRAYAAPLEQTYGQWRERHLDSSYRKELDKKSKQLNRRGLVSFKCVEDPASIKVTFDAFKAYRSKRFEGTERAGDLLQVRLFADFYLGVATAGRDTFTRTYSLSIDGKPIAGTIGLAHRGSFLIILSGFDEAAYKRQSIGSLLFEQVARDCIDRGERSLDFTIGDEPYKRLFGGVPSPMWQISRAGTPLGYAAGLLIENLPAAKTLAKRLLQALKGRE